MDFAQLRDADIPSLEKLVAPWGKAALSLSQGGEIATTNVGNKIRSGTWEGKAAQTAKTKVAGLEKQLSAGDTEATTIQGILKKAVTAFTASQKRLKTAIKTATDNPQLNIDDSGHVSVKRPDFSDVLSGDNIIVKYIQLQSIAVALNTEITDTIGDARQIDGMVATVLRAAAQVDDDKNLDFNGDAASDGAITLPTDGNIAGNMPQSMVPNQVTWYSKLLGMAGSEPFASGTPQEQSTGVGSLVKSEVERAGGECKLVQGMMVCVGAPKHMYARGGTTYGDTFISSSSSWQDFDSMSENDKNNLINHEKYHRDHQWQKYGVSFGRKYLAAELEAMRLGYTNPYEIAAERYGGETGYDITEPPKPNPQPGPSPKPSPGG